jgi:hypothetical protein
MHGGERERERERNREGGRGRERKEGENREVTIPLLGWWHFPFMRIELSRPITC